MPHREPTDEEIKKLPILGVSSPEGKWEPQKISKGYFNLDIALDSIDARYTDNIIEYEYGSKWHQTKDVQSRRYRYKFLGQNHSLEWSEEQVGRWQE